eukprot:6766874-Heterocapsa_arctica.AAC.1
MAMISDNNIMRRSVAVMTERSNISSAIYVLGVFIRAFVSDPTIINTGVTIYIQEKPWEQSDQSG